MAELTFQGETFGLEDSYAAMVIADAATEASAGGVSELVAFRNILQHLILPEEWDRFHALCVSSRANEQALLKAVQDAVEAINERPTELPSDSSDGHESTPARSEGDSSLRVIGRLEGKGRPDLALQVTRTQEHMQRESLTA